MKMRQEFGFALGFTAFEIYNEKVIDLLIAKKNNRLFAPLDQNKKHNGHMSDIEQLTNSSIYDLYSFKDLFDLSQNNKKVGENKLNSKSSRSHCIYKLTLNFKTKASSLYLIDLAGVERSKYLDMSKGMAPQMTETCNINRSLTTLSRCFQALRDNSVVPYRESKLTKLLFDNMAKEVSISIIINFNSSHSSFEDNLRVLEFAAVAKDISPDLVERNVSFVAMKSRSKIADSSYKYLNDRFNESKRKKNEFVKEKQEQLRQCILNLKKTLTINMHRNRLDSVNDTLKGMNQLRLMEIETQLSMNNRTYLSYQERSSSRKNIIDLEEWDTVTDAQEIEEKVLRLLRYKKLSEKDTALNIKYSGNTDHEADFAKIEIKQEVNRIEIEKLASSPYKENAETQKEVARSQIKAINVEKHSKSVLDFDEHHSLSHAANLCENSFGMSQQPDNNAYENVKNEPLLKINSLTDFDMSNHLAKETTIQTLDTLYTQDEESNQIDCLDHTGISTDTINILNAKQLLESQNPTEAIVSMHDHVELPVKRGKRRGKTQNKNKPNEPKATKKKVTKKQQVQASNNVFVDFLAFIEDPQVGKKPLSGRTNNRDTLQSISCNEN